MRGVASLLLGVLVACGGDDDGDTQATASTTLTTAATSESSSSTTGDGSTSGTPGSSSEESSTAIADASSSEATSSGGVAEDPEYPPTDNGTCPADFAPIELPGGSVCAPFCAGADAPCPAPASGDAMPTCTPFATEGGSGTPCTSHDDCVAPEACGVMDTCVAVAFWGCRLECSGGEACSDGMVCAGDACAYP